MNDPLGIAQWKKWFFKSAFYCFVLSAMVVLRMTGSVCVGAMEDRYGGVPQDKLHSLNPPVLLPDGTEFLTWEPKELTFTKTYYADQSTPKADDANPFGSGHGVRYRAGCR